MATFLFADHIGQTITGFDVAADVLSFLSDTDGSAAGVTFNISGTDLVLTTAAGSVTLAGVSIREITSSNVTFSDTSQIFVGDDTTDIFADDAAQAGTADVQLDGNGNNNVWLFGAADTANIDGDGDNFVHGNAGADDIDINGTGNNIVRLGADNDASTMAAAATGNNFVRGDSGADTIVVGGTGNNTIWGGSGLAGASDGADTITLEATATGDNSVNGNAGDDTITVITGADGDNTIRGGAGVDTIVTDSDGSQVVKGDSGADVITINGDGDNLVYGDNVIGDTGADTITIDGTGDNTVWGGVAGGTADVDTITIAAGAIGNNFVNGNSGDDVITLTTGATGGDNTLRGGAGADTITITDANANIAFGDNSLRGDTGDDSLVVSFTGTTASISTSLEGGAGADTFDVTLDDADHDVAITDFDAASDEILFDPEGETAATLVVTRAAGDTHVEGTTGSLEAVTLENFSGNFTATNFVMEDGSVLLTNFGGSAATLTSVTGEDDQLIAGNGGDTLVGSTGNDVLTGGTGADTFTFTGTIATALSGTTSVLDGNSGTDTLRIITDAVTLQTGDFAVMSEIEKVVVAANVATSITTGAGGLAAGINYVDVSALTSADSTLALSSLTSATTVVGGGAIDTVTVGVAANNVSLGAGADILNLTADVSGTLAGGTGADTLNDITGTTLSFTGTNVGSFETLNIANTGAVNLTLTSAYDATLQAATTLTITNDSGGAAITFSDASGTADISFTGDAAIDTVTTGAGDDTIATVGGADVINAGGGDDDITGGAAADVMTGGSGDDTFNFLLIADTSNEITDFEVGAAADVFAIDASGFGGGTLDAANYVEGTSAVYTAAAAGAAANDDSVLVFTDLSGFADAAAVAAVVEADGNQDDVVYVFWNNVSEAVEVYYDITSTAAAAPVLLATLSNLVAADLDDFVAANFSTF